MAEVNPETCTNCGRPFTSRECADPAHRAAQGFDYDTDAELRMAGKAECSKCGKVKPVLKFYRNHRQAKTCNQCGWEAKVARRSKRRGANLHEYAVAERFWEAQATRHS